MKREVLSRLFGPSRGKTWGTSVGIGSLAVAAFFLVCCGGFGETIERWFYFPPSPRPAIIREPMEKTDGTGKILKFSFEEFPKTLPRRSRELRREVEYLLELQEAAGEPEPNWILQEKLKKSALVTERLLQEKTLAAFQATPTPTIIGSGSATAPASSPPMIPVATPTETP